VAAVAAAPQLQGKDPLEVAAARPVQERGLVPRQDPPEVAKGVARGVARGVAAVQRLF